MIAAFLLLTQANAEPFMRMPDIHGDRVAFVCEGDIWLGSLQTGEAKRLTRHPGKESFPRFAPDGTRIAFSASYDGVPETYVMPATGGAPTRLSYRLDYAEPMAWTPDGVSVLYRGRSFPRSYGLYLANSAGGPEQKLPIEFASHGTYGPDGRIAFTRFNRWSTAWFHYEGGMQNQIWIGDMGAKTFRQLTNLQGTNEFPAWEGTIVYFANERDAKFTVYSVVASGGTPKRIAGPYSFEVRELNAGPGAVVYEKGRGIEMVDLKSGKRSELKFAMDSDLMHTRPYTVLAQDFAESYSLTPTGKRVFVEARGQLLTIPAGDGEARVWMSQPGVRLRRPKMSPDGTKVAYVSDQGGEQQIWISGSEGSDPRQLTKGSKRQIMALDWSPDSKKIAYYESGMKLWLIDVASGQETLVVYSGGGNGNHDWWGLPVSFSPDSKWLAYSHFDGITDFGRIAIRNLASGEVRDLGSGLTDDDYPSFSKDGKYLAFLSRRSFSMRSDSAQNQLNAAPMIVPCLYLLQNDGDNPLATKDTTEAPLKKAEEDKKIPEAEWEGIEDRLVVLPVAPGTYNSIAIAGPRVIMAGDGNISFYDLAAKLGGTIAAGDSFELSHDGKKLLIADRVVDATAKDLPATAGKLSYGALRIQIEPLEEWKQIYWDAWRLLRDYFYVANMHGVDWGAIGAKYAALLPSVRSRDELSELIRWLQSEIGSSHQYLGGGDEQSLGKPVPGAFLGIDVAADSMVKRLKITKILRGDGINPAERSPLLEAGFKVKEGDYLMAIGGQNLTDKSNYQSLLAGRAGQTVGVTVASKADGSDRRTLFVKPVATENRMRILDWVSENRRYVDKATGGKVGYLYLQAMSTGDMADFVRQYYPQRNKQAMIIDTRFNNGGFVQTLINRVLSTQLSAHFNQRNRPSAWTRQWDYFAGPMACLINEFNVSCGEEFPARFRDLKIGPLIGRRTVGGEIGSDPGWPLVDGGRVFVPNYGMFTPDGKWAIEGPGVSPDIDVPSDPNAFAKGVDPQLDRTIKYLLDQVAKKPTTWPVPPQDRIYVKPGGGR
jgi:tricorn protease